MELNVSSAVAEESAVCVPKALEHVRSPHAYRPLLTIPLLSYLNLNPG
jgi:hypothetical protein